MGSLSDAEKKKLAYFHALGKAMTEGTQEVYESRYKSSHNVRLTEVWADHINSAVTYSDAVIEASTNSAVTLYTQVTLTQIPGSNGQTYYYDSGGTFVRPWISPVDVPNTITNTPSDGYQVRLFRGNSSEIYLTDGAWAVDYYAGIIHFSVGYTPADLGWGAIKATFFQYSGTYGASGGTTNAFTTAVFNSGTSQLIFNSGTPSQTIVDLSSLSGGTDNSSLSTALSVEISDRTDADESLSTAIDSIPPPTPPFNPASLSSAISTEKSDRISGDTSLSIEISISNSGITSLSTALSTVISGNTYDDSSLSTRISTEESNRLSGDTSLTTRISTEESVRYSTDMSLSTAILGAGGGTGVTSLSTALSVEESSRISSDAVLSQAIEDIVSGITSSGGTIATSNIGMTASGTTADGDLACSTGVTSLPIPKSYISVYVNGVQVNVGDGVKTQDCYFSADGGTTAKLWINIGLSDLLYWNGSIIGYQLSSTTDKVSFIYLTI